MSTKRRQTVDQWVTSTIAEVIDGRTCTAVSCLHLKGVGGAVEEIVTKPLEGPVNVKELADHLISRAEGFAQELPGLQTFKLIAFYGTNEPHNPFHFTVSDGSVISRTEAMTAAHEPTPTGLLNQLMKHNEAFSQQIMALTNTITQMSQGVLGMCFGPQGFIAQSQQSQLDAIAVVKDSMLDMFKQRQEAEVQKLDAAKQLQTRQAIIDALPHMVNRITGHPIFDETSNKAAIIDKLALRISPQDLDLLVQLGKISREEALLLSAQFAAIVDEKRKEHEALKQVPSEEGTSALVSGANGKNEG